MAADEGNDAVFEHLLTVLEQTVELCGAADRDTRIAAIQARCATAARLAAELIPSG